MVFQLEGYASWYSVFIVFHYEFQIQMLSVTYSRTCSKMLFDCLRDK